MSIFEEEIQIEEIGFDSIDDNKSIHLWKVPTSGGTWCGSNKDNHDCHIVEVHGHEKYCYYCAKPYCEYCLFLFNEYLRSL